jgi:hypothetical protein
MPTPFVLVAALVAQSATSPPPDSQTILKAARRAQGEFERTRRWHLPFAPPAERCDECVGRFCYCHGDDGAEAEQPAEPEQIRRARDALLVALDSFATLLPGDGWVAGQRVRYLIEEGRTRDAVLAAGACRAVPWWCRALAGLARHAAREFPAADSAFDAALGLMPPDECCRWTDLSPLLEGELAKRYRALACDERSDLEARLWWLARPLWSQPGNDRRSEHFARHTMVLLRDAPTPYGLPWGRDLAELTLRYGWPLWWTRAPPRATGTAADVAVTGHHATPSFPFLPPTRAALDPAAAREEDFTLHAARPRERYAPSYAKAFTAPAHQAAVFRRGDTALVVAAYDLTADTVFAQAPLAAALVLARDERTRPVVARRDHAPPRGVLHAAGAWAPLVLSLEVTMPERHHVARARYGWRPPAAERRVSLSDLLLFAADDSLPMTLEQAAPHALGSRAVPSDRQLGLYWELYGLGAGGSGRGATEVVTTAVTVLPLKRGFLGLGRSNRVRLEWQDQPERVNGIGARTLTLDLSGLAPGRYRVVLSVKPADEPPVTASREIAVSRKP